MRVRNKNHQGTPTANEADNTPTAPATATAIPARCVPPPPRNALLIVEVGPVGHNDGAGVGAATVGAGIGENVAVGANVAVGVGVVGASSVQLSVMATASEYAPEDPAQSLRSAPPLAGAVRLAPFPLAEFPVTRRFEQTPPTNAPCEIWSTHWSAVLLIHALYLIHKAGRLNGVPPH